MSQTLQVSAFHIDHVVPTAAGGMDAPDNLALACPTCNLKKATRTSVADPDTGRPAPLFNPRIDAWNDHFAWVGYRIAGRTPIGRATVEALELNSLRRVRVRAAEEWVGLFPADVA